MTRANLKRGGVSSDNELISFITGSITKGIIPMEIEAPEIGCSSFRATAANGDVLFSRNYDFSKTTTAIVFTDGGNGRYKTILLVDLQFLGIDPNKGINGFMDKVISLATPYVPLDGINEKGLAVGIYMTYQGKDETIPTNQITDKPDITSTTMLRLMLDYAATVDEAVEIAKSYDLHDSANTSYHYMVADATGRSGILEWVCESDNLDNDGSKRELEVIYNELNKVNGVVADMNAAMDILKLVGRRSWNNDDGNGCTVHSVVYNLTEKKMLWVSNENFSDEAAIFEFGF